MDQARQRELLILSALKLITSELQAPGRKERVDPAAEQWESYTIHCRDARGNPFDISGPVLSPRWVRQELSSGDAARQAQALEALAALPHACLKPYLGLLLHLALSVDDDSLSYAGLALWRTQVAARVLAGLDRGPAPIAAIARTLRREHSQRLLESFANRHHPVRHSLPSLIAEIGDEEALAALLKALLDPLESVAIRLDILRILTAHPPGPGLTSILPGLLNDREPTIRMEAATALVRLGDPQAPGLALRLLSDADPEVAERAVALVAGCAGPAEVAALQEIAGWRSRERKEVKARAQAALKRWQAR